MTDLLPSHSLGRKGAKREDTAADLTRDLFDRGEPTYPAFPGSKGGTTSRQAAEAIAPMAKNMRGKVAKLYADNHPRGFTADEAAKELGATPFMVRPRVTELGAAGLIEKTGERRPNPASTLNAAVWRATDLLRSAAGGGAR